MLIIHNISIGDKSLIDRMWRSVLKKPTKHIDLARNKQIQLQNHIHYCSKQSLNLVCRTRRVEKRAFSTNKSDKKLENNVIVPLNGRQSLQLNFGKLARFADGSCVAKIGGTSVLVTAVSKRPSNFQDSTSIQNVAPSAFVPLTVDYRQKAAAAGRIPTNHLRRELGPTENEILTSRVIDRSLRPLFPKGYGSETQIICNLLSTDGAHDPCVVALNGASAALAFSDIPWNGPIGATRVSYSKTFGQGTGGFVLNPTRKELRTISEQNEKSLNLLVSGDKNDLVVMLEADAGCIDRALFLDGIKFGLESSSIIAKYIHSESNKVGITKRPNPYTNDIDAKRDLDHPQSRAYNLIELLCEQKLRTIYENNNHDKTSRDNATFSLRDSAISQIRNNNQFSSDPSYLHDAFTRISRKVLSSLVLDQNVRVDGRDIDEVRPITCHVDTHPPLHGSALFQRGQTQVFCTVSLDSLESTALKLDPVSTLMGGAKEKNFFLHYEFPPYATNEIGRSGAASGRRELGHGALAEKGLRAVVPKDHPFTIRLTSEVLESNGSSSMASICGGSLALLDAGVPLNSPAAGVAMGLVSREVDNDIESINANREYVVLTDILGMEDFLGDMDFKVAGTRHGITALQADIKLPGIPLQIVETALNKGHDAINRILDIMENSREDRNEPRTSKNNWPVKESINIPAHKRGRFVGPGGSNLKRILAETGVQVTPESGTEASTTWSLFAPNTEALSEAKEIIETVLAEEKLPELEFGSIYPSIIREIREKGVMVELHPEMPLVYIPNSQLDAKKVCILR